MSVYAGGCVKRVLVHDAIYKDIVKLSFEYAVQLTMKMWNDILEHSTCNYRRNV